MQTGNVKADPKHPTTPLDGVNANVDQAKRRVQDQVRRAKAIGINVSEQSLLTQAEVTAMWWALDKAGLVGMALRNEQVGRSYEMIAKTLETEISKVVLLPPTGHHGPSMRRSG